jgi:hypothetical protein
LLQGIALGLWLTACGGPATRLVTVKEGSGTGKVDFEVKNLTDVPINTFHLAPTEKVNAAGGRVDPHSPAGADLWGPDLLGVAIPTGKSQPVPVTPGRWDARAVDRDGREQLVTGLKLAGNGRYILELYEGGWRVYD